MKITSLAVLAFAGVAALASGQASAASPITEAFLANAKPNVAFIEASSKLALRRSKDAGVQSFAQSGAAEAVAVAEALDQRSTAVADAGGLTTGRSVAMASRSDGVAALGQAANGRAPMGRTDLDGLAKLSGRRFLDAFWLKQLDALSQLRADYTAYIAKGDDPALVAVAQRELRAVESRLAALSKI